MLEGFEAIRALAEGYAFLNSIDDRTMNDVLWAAIEQGGLWLNNDKEWIKDQNINGHAWGAWAASGIYMATGKVEYLPLAEEFIEDFIYNYQRADGSWITPGFPEDNQEIWHDSFMQYHGVILRGLSEIYALTYDSSLKDTLKSKITSTINHVISYNQQYGGNKTRLLNYDYAFISKYHVNHTGFYQLETNNNNYDLMTPIRKLPLNSYTQM